MFARIDMVSVKKEIDAIQIGAHELKIARLEVFEEVNDLNVFSR